MSDSGSEYEYDVDQEGEELDENLTPEYPPDRPLGLYDEEATGLSAPGGDDGTDLDDTEPDVWERPEDEEAGEEPPVLEGESDVDAIDDEKDLVATPLEQEQVGPLSEDDQVTGDETRRDVATERVPRPAEEDAVRLDEDPPGAVG
jgi:hypothetical protein